MILQSIGELSHAVLLVSLVCLILAGLWPIWLVAQHLRMRKRGMARDRALLRLDLPPDPQLPHVLVQLPMFNEPQVARRVIEAAGALDWPVDKLHIQVLDDSTDETTAIAREAAAVLQARGRDIVLLHRAQRIGFKASALREGLRRSPYEYIAIFDADFVPAPDFLRLCLRPLISDAGLAFVQARWDWINAGQNALTRAQRLMHDAHFAVDQTARNWSGHVTHFCGSGGVWRRSAIEDAGGWSTDILPEDIDLCYRAQLKGWRSLYLVDVSVPGELPDCLDAWRVQQARWARGLAQMLRKTWWPIWRSELTVGQKIVAGANLLVATSGVIVHATLLAALADCLFGAGPTPLTVILAVLAVLTCAGGGAAMLALGQSRLRHASPWRSIPRIGAATSYYAYAQVRAALGVLEGLGGGAADFVRTPKKGVVSRG